MTQYYVIGNNAPIPNLANTSYNGHTIVRASDLNDGQSNGTGNPEGGDLLPNDEVVISDSVDSNVSLHPATGTEQTNAGFSSSPTVPITVKVLANSNSFDIDFDASFGNELSPVIDVLGDAGKVDIRGQDTDGMTLRVADNAKIGDVEGGTENTDNDVIETGANSTIGNIDTNAGDDVVTIGGQAGTIQTEGGDDLVTINQGGNTGAIATGGGDDQVTVSGTTLNVTTGGGDDVVSVTDTGVTRMIGTGTGSDQVTVAGSSQNVMTGMGDDILEVTQTGQVADIGTEGGDDQVTVNGGAGNVSVGNGSDGITLGDGATTGDLVLGYGGATGDTISAGNGVRVDGNINQAISNALSDVQFGDNTTVTGGIDLNGGDDTLSFGDGARITGPIRTGDDVSTSDEDSLTIGANSIIDGFVNTNTGDDYVEIGAGTQLNGNAGEDGTALNTQLGNDTVILGAGVTATNDIFTGAGSDEVYASTGSFTVDQGFNYPNNDLIEVDFGGGGEAAFEAALLAQGFAQSTTGPYAGTAYDNGSNSTFTYGGITYNLADWITAVCFTTGTMIETAGGETLIDDLKVGDLVMTRDNGLQPIRWIGQRALSGDLLVDQLKPIRISAGALGAGTPAADLLVSPQHRVLVRSKIAQRMFGTDEVLVAAKQLLQIEGVDIADVAEVTYVHILFDRHEVIMSNGAETESLFTGPEALKSVGPAARAEIFAIFPELADRDYAPVPARVMASGRMGRKLAVRHAQNGKALIN